jgi:acyl-CoA synthetase (AMP-forming)/AMP-acid ligase II
VSRAALYSRVVALIDRLAHGGRDDAARDALLRDILRCQRDAIPAYARIVERLGDPAADPLSWPAVPTDVFRFARLAAHAPERDVRVFRTSGTSGANRGRHHLCDLSLYDRAAEAAARYALFPDRPRMRLVILAASSTELPDSSLSYMLERFLEWFGDAESTHVLRDGQLDLESLERVLEGARRQGAPVALVGTSFAFVHAEDALGARRFALAPGSRIMQTGGFKGRSREVDPDAMLQLLSARYGVPLPFIVQEYGMTELCSQLYETTLRDAALGAAPGPRRLWVPGWVRALAVDPQTLAPLPDGELGILRIDDPCNLDGISAIQSADRALTVGGGVQVKGRMLGAIPRGCSIAVDSVLAHRSDSDAPSRAGH